MPPGGGGLVILPQKSWNVWRNDNRQRVLRDEKKHEEEEKARRKRQREVEAEIRLERLRGAQISNEDAKARVDEALETMNLDDYIERKTMRELAEEHTRRVEKGLNRPRKRRRFDNDQPEAPPPKSKERQPDFSATNVPFTLFAGEESRSTSRRIRRKLDKNPEREEEEKKIKEKEQQPFRWTFANSSVEKAANVPWYLVTDPEEKERRGPMLPENHQKSLPDRHKDFSKDPRYIERRNKRKKQKYDPLTEMTDILGDKPSNETSNEPQQTVAEYLKNEHAYGSHSESFRDMMSKFDKIDAKSIKVEDDSPSSDDSDDNSKSCKKKRKKRKRSAKKKKKDKHKSKKKKNKRRRSESLSDSNEEDRHRKKRRKKSPSSVIDRLREERFAREREEKRRKDNLGRRYY